jgi:proton-dependent oligopeptide transporter, POT family
MLQAWSYILIGAGEIFAVSAAYEVAYTASPPEKKVLASALNLFCVGGLPNIISFVLYQACSPWFHNSVGTNSISHIDEYATAHIARYFWLLLGICIFGVWINLLPQVREFVESIEEKATDLLKSPKTPKAPPRVLRDEEQSPLIRAKRHHAYLKYGSGPVLYKHGSMRAGPNVAIKRAKTERHLKRSMIPKLYQGKSKSDAIIGVGAIMSADGKPIRAGDLLMMRHASDDEFAPLKRTSSD